MEILLTVILWIVMGGATSYFAAQRGRDPFAWFLVGMMLGLIGLIVLFLLPSLEEREEDGHEEEMEVTGEESELTPQTPSSNDGYWFRDWFYLNEKNQQFGPISFQVLKKTWLEGKVSRDTFVWSEGMETWQRVQDLPGLIDNLN
ncbi:MAG: DUF4339 domain-containing protein [Parachlamydiaceae bacterium]